jgi:hypothetical protein
MMDIPIDIQIWANITVCDNKVVVSNRSAMRVDSYLYREASDPRNGLSTLTTFSPTLASVESHQ